MGGGLLTKGWPLAILRADRANPRLLPFLKARRPRDGKRGAGRNKAESHRNKRDLTAKVKGKLLRRKKRKLKTSFRLS